MRYGNGIQICLEEWGTGAFEQATLHLLTPAFIMVRRSLRVFASYNTPKGPAIFRLREHVERLFASARVLGFVNSVDV